MEDGNGEALPRFDVVNFATTSVSGSRSTRSCLTASLPCGAWGRKQRTRSSTVLTVPTLRTMRLGWELWEALAEGNGEDPEILLVERLALDKLETARRALWGEVWPAEIA